MMVCGHYFQKKTNRIFGMWILAPALIPVLALILVMGGRVEAVAQVPLTVRSADHPNFSRIVFDWPERVSYTPVLSEDTLRITFGRNAVPDFGRLQNRPLRFFGNPRYRQDERTEDRDPGGRERHRQASDVPRERGHVPRVEPEGRELHSRPVRRGVQRSASVGAGPGVAESHELLAHPPCSCGSMLISASF